MDYKEAIIKLLDKITDQTALIRIFKFVTRVYAK
jgi:hypothetical protein